MEKEEPLVSIVCDVFNHGPFLRNALDGFLNQQVNFPIEILIHDDASTDNSAEIIREYEKKYPNLIRPLYETDNQYYKQHIWADIQFPRVKGRYIALCEGDDYWTDPLKLQKQVDYMESHPDCSMCFGNSIVHWEDGSRPDRPHSSLKNRVYSGKEICWAWGEFDTATYLFRQSIVKSPLYPSVLYNKKMVAGDLPLVLLCASAGKLFAFSDSFSVYRRHSGGLSMNLDSLSRMKWGELWEEIPHLFGRQYKNVSVFWAIYHYRAGMRAAIYEKDSLRYEHLRHKILSLYTHHPIGAGIRLWKIVKEKI